MFCRECLSLRSLQVVPLSPSSLSSERPSLPAQTPFLMGPHWLSCWQRSVLAVIYRSLLCIAPGMLSLPASSTSLPRLLLGCRSLLCLCTEHPQCPRLSTPGPKHSSLFAPTAHTDSRAASMWDGPVLTLGLASPLFLFQCFLEHLLISKSPSPKPHLRACF